MHARISVDSNQHAAIDFDCELPVVPEPNPHLESRFTAFLFHRGQVNLYGGSMRSFAAAMWRCNRGCWIVEVEHAGRYEEFGRDLMMLNGLNGITSASRFTLGIEVGRCFDTADVAVETARIVHSHFYPTQELSIARELACDTETLVPADPTRVPPSPGPAKTHADRGSGTREVAVYRVTEPADQEFGRSHQAEIEVLSIVEIELADMDDTREICAEAWIRSVGRVRQEFLRERLDAPESIVQAQGDRNQIAEALTEIPAGFGPIEGFLYDNMVETWLLELAWDPSFNNPADDTQSPRF